MCVLGDELSDLDSLELTSSEDESSSEGGSESESNKSWETEDEEEEFGVDGMRVLIFVHVFLVRKRSVFTQKNPIFVYIR